MIKIFNKTIGSFLCLAVLITSVCLPASVNAHSHDDHKGYEQLSSHEINVGNTSDIDHDQEHSNFCSESSDTDKRYTTSNIKVQAQCIVLECPIQYWSQDDNLTLELTNNYIQANSPPDNSERTKSERNSTRLLI